jgi:hypothetical protein
VAIGLFLTRAGGLRVSLAWQQGHPRLRFTPRRQPEQDPAKDPAIV